MAKPTIDEAKKYYSEHPQLFSERRIYNIQEIVLPAAAGVGEELRSMLDSGKSMENIAQWLKGKDIKFAAGTATRSAEQIPLELLPKIHPLKVGQGLILQSPQIRHGHAACSSAIGTGNGRSGITAYSAVPR